VEAGQHRTIILDLFLECPARRLNYVSLNLVSEAVGVDDKPAVMGDHHAFDPDLAVGLVYFDFSNGSDISFGAIVLNERDTAPAIEPWPRPDFLRRWTTYPAGSFCCSLEDGLSARIAQVSQAKL